MCEIKKNNKKGINVNDPLYLIKKINDGCKSRLQFKISTVKRTKIPSPLQSINDSRIFLLIFKY